jgi:hypothetical protein
MKVTLYDATIESFHSYPGEDGSSSVLVIEAPLTQQLATKLRRKGLFFDDNGIPRTFEGKVGLGITIDSTEVFIGQRSSIHADKIWKFGVSRKEDKGEADGKIIGFTLSFRAHFKKDAAVAYGIHCDQNKASTTIDLSASQQDFGFEDEDAPSDASEQQRTAENASEDEPIENHLQGPALAAHREMVGPRARRQPTREVQ